VLWLIAEDGLRLRLHQSFSITFYAAGPQTRLHDLVAFLRSQPIKLNLGREERRDLFQEQRLTVLTIRVENAAEQPRLFRRVAEHSPIWNITMLISSSLCAMPLCTTRFAWRTAVCNIKGMVN